ncbi:MAG: MotA/TolQ/ExbB proton channel family protein [Limnobacter sp.]|nr:MotA/TolQ/ExbB proton channel family protein [Limnobacter sp.]
MSPTESAEVSQLGFSHFLAQADGVSIFLFVVLLLMSICTWAIVLTKLRARIRIKKRRQDFEAWWAAKPEALDAVPGLTESDFGRLLGDAHHTLDLFKAGEQAAHPESTQVQEALSRTIQQSLDLESSRLESGQTALASIASCAPFVGLFGTVWGIYHALLSLGASGQSTLDQVAGPVGEALIMTALGLAVAIPAAMAFNLFQRQSRVTLAQLERFAHDFYVQFTAKHRFQGE